MSLPQHAFTPSVPWEHRSWLWNERIVKWLSARPALALLLLAPLLPLLLLLAPLLALWVARSSLPPPAGAYAVGVHDFEHSSLRLRVWYPRAAAPAPPPRWLPQPRASYAAAYLTSLGAPYWLGALLTAPLRLISSRGMAADAPPLRPPHGQSWHLVLFSHGLLGNVAPYSMVCASIASHGAVVIALEHTDGSAVHTEAAAAPPYLTRPPQHFADNKAWRAAQVELRVRQLTALLRAGGGLLASTPLASLEAEDLSLARDGAVALVGHSFGGGTVLETAAALAAEEGAPVVSACVALDPWLFGCSDALLSAPIAAAKVPTLCLMTQSLMFPTNADAIGPAMRNFSRDGGTALWVEAAGTRHQEASDFVLFAYPLIRASFMAGALPGSLSLGRHIAATVGFLSCAGALRVTGDPTQRKSMELVGALASGEAPSKRRGARVEAEYDASAFLVHGATAFA
ncbi:hypothetical protein AB1Y20_021916 [Prymnesium parvum]|uniref:1-alkyl-2-acetylglycerophosphocholine esterase n=1 Tax=Prymnesium parvum TaxID=97485 RepID=A0AB34JEU0_PRYPA